MDKLNTGGLAVLALVLAILFATVLVKVGFLGVDEEYIKEQTYRMDSLQYLEDIRNSNDEILKALNK